jgi:MFS family permease
VNGSSPSLDRGSLRAKLIAIVTLIVITSVLALGVASLFAFDRAVEPELASRERLIGTTIRTEIQRALDLGIPFESISGLDRYLQESLDNFDEVVRIAVNSSSRQTISVVERPQTTSTIGQSGFGELISLKQKPFVHSILEGNKLVGRISIETDPRFVQKRIRDVFLDVLVIAIVATIVTLELALAVTVTNVSKPLDRLMYLLRMQGAGDFTQRIRSGGLGGLRRAAARLNDHAEDLAERLAKIPNSVRDKLLANIPGKMAEGHPLRMRLSDIHDIRPALFLYSVAAEISASFLPIYAKAASRPGWLTPETAAAAPLMMYLVALASLTPFAGSLSRRYGARKMFLGSIPPTALALIAMGFSHSVIEIAVWRGVLAVFYAVATIACQEYAIRASSGKGDTRPVGAFIAVIYGGVFCGSALGGLIAGRFGFQAAFIFGGIGAISSGFLAWFAMRGRAGDPHSALLTKPIEDGVRRPFTFRFAGLLIGLAMPLNAATAIFIWYLTPLILAGSGSDPAEIGRVVMLYYLAVVLFGTVVTGLSDNRIGPLPLVILGASGSAASLLILSHWNGFWAVVAAVTGMGLCHTLMRAPIYAVAVKMTGGAAAGFSILRLAERVGALIGLGASALLLGRIGADFSITTLAVAILAGLSLYIFTEFFGRFSPGR